MPVDANVDPEWAKAALAALLPVTGPKRTAAISASSDPIAQLNYLLNYGLFKDEQRAYNNFMGSNPIKYKTPEPATPAPAEPAKPPIDPAKMSLARQRALDNAMLNLRAQGVDPAPFLPLINAEFDKRAATAELEDDPYSVFSDDIADNVVKAELGQKQKQFMEQFDAQFGQAADRAQLPASLLDDTINQILAEQRGSAVEQLERGKKRGIYNDVGYSAGLSAIDNAMARGRSDLNSVGGGLIDKYIGDLNKIDDRAYSAYGANPFGNFSLDPYIAERGDFLGRTRSNAAGDLRGAIGGRNFFDFSNIAQASGKAQGALNLRDTDVATALNERKRQNSLSRGLGSQGAF